MQLIYVDDSAGAGHALLTAIIVDARRWAPSLGRWLNLRQTLAYEYGLAKTCELHAGKFVSGRGWPSQADPGAAINRDHDLRRAIYFRALDTIAADPDLAVVTVDHLGGQDRSATYLGLLAHLHRWRAAHDSHGLVVMDGEDQLYPRLHRTLPLEGRRIVEDSWLQESRTSQFVQIADLVAHAAFQSVAHQASREWMWSWYSERFAPIVTLE